MEEAGALARVETQDQTKTLPLATACMLCVWLGSSSRSRVTSRGGYCLAIAELTGPSALLFGRVETLEAIIDICLRRAAEDMVVSKT